MVHRGRPAPAPARPPDSLTVSRGNRFPTAPRWAHVPRWKLGRCYRCRGVYTLYGIAGDACIRRFRTSEARLIALFGRGTDTGTEPQMVVRRRLRQRARRRDLPTHDTPTGENHASLTEESVADRFAQWWRERPEDCGMSTGEL